MSTKLIIDTIEEIGISSLKVLYDFKSYSGDYINSNYSESESFSGKVINFNQDFTGTASGSGFFNNQYIEIENTENIENENATVIFSFKKTGIGNSTIFSHIDPNGPSGWEIGINEANKYYFKNFSEGSPQYFFLQSYLSDQNLCALSVGEFGHIEMHKLSFEKKEEEPFSSLFVLGDEDVDNVQYYGFDSRSFSVPNFSISNGSAWKVGSGEFLHNGYMDCFLYFEDGLSRESISKIVNSVYSETNLIPDVSGYVTGEVTGFLKTSSGVSGKIGENISTTGIETQSGFYVYPSGLEKTGFADISGHVYFPYYNIDQISGTEQIGQNVYKKVNNLSYTFSATGDPEPSSLTGFESSGSYWHFSGNSGEYKSHSAVGPVGTIFGITGFEIIDVTGYVTGISNKKFEKQELSGVSYYEYEYEPMYSPSTGYLISGAYYTGNQSEPDPQYYPNSISLIADSSGFYEIVYDIDEGYEISKKAISSMSLSYNQFVGNMESQSFPYNTETYINGVSNITGTFQEEKDQYNKKTYKIDKGVFIENCQIFSSLSLDAKDLISYDTIESGEIKYIEIDSTSDYLNSPFSLEIEGKQVFFNGIKIYSGIDYLNNAGFYPSGNVTGSTGIYHAVDIYKNSISQTGSGSCAINIKHESITPGKSVFYLNGVRDLPKNLIYHSANSDLISGTNKNIIKERLIFMENGESGRP